LSEEKENQLGKTLEAYRKVSIALNALPNEEKISIKDLALKANVHWSTAKKALLFFGMMSPLVPKFRMISGTKFRILEKPDAIDAVEGVFESGEMRTLVKLMLVEAIEENNAIEVDDFLSPEEKTILQELIYKGLVNSVEGCFYLSKKGQSLASIGVRRLVDLGIELPWDKPAKRLFVQFTKFPEGQQTSMFGETWKTLTQDSARASESWSICTTPHFQPHEDQVGWSFRRSIDKSPIKW
jgi:hypothetical protein